MPKLEDFVNKQKDGAKFVISSAMLKLTTQEFDLLAQHWIKDGGPGFQITGVPFRRCIDGDFFIDRVTAVKLAPA